MEKGVLKFSVIWLGYLFSEIGSGLTAFSLSVYAFRQTALATSSTLVILATFLPAFFMLPFAGVIADRIDRRLVMICGNVGSAIGIVIVVGALVLYPHQLWLIYPGIVVSSIFFGIQHPSYKASITDFLPTDMYAKASGLVQLASSAQFLIAPALAGYLLSVTHINNILIIDVITFVLAAGLILFVRANMAADHKVSYQKTGFFADLRVGIRVIVHDRRILTLTIIVSLILFCVGLIQALLAPMVLSFTTAHMLGLAQSSCAIGMLVSALFVSVLGRAKDKVPGLCFSLALMGLAFAFIGVKPNIWAIILPGFIFFSTIPFVNSSIEVLIRKNIENKHQGRVWSIISVITYLGAMIAYAISGVLADRWFNPMFNKDGLLANSLGHFFGIGPGRGIACMFFLAGIILIILAVIIMYSKSIRSLDQSGHENCAQFGQRKNAYGADSEKS